MLPFACPGDPKENRKIEAYVMGQQAIERQLKNPNGAKFPAMSERGVVVNCEGAHCIASSYVDATNGFGATIRSRWWAEMHDNGDGTWRIEKAQLVEN